MLEKVKRETAGLPDSYETASAQALLMERIKKAKTPEELEKLNVEIENMKTEGKLKVRELAELEDTYGTRKRNLGSDVKGDWFVPEDGDGEAVWIDRGQDAPAGYVKTTEKEVQHHYSPYERAKQGQMADVDGPEFVKELDTALMDDMKYIEVMDDPIRAAEYRINRAIEKLASANNVSADNVVYVKGQGFYDISQGTSPDKIKYIRPPLDVK